MFLCLLKKLKNFSFFLKIQHFPLYFPYQCFESSKQARHCRNLGIWEGVHTITKGETLKTVYFVPEVNTKKPSS